MTRPRIKDCFTLHFFRSSVAFASDRKTFFISGSNVKKVCELIDGVKTVDEILDMCAADSISYAEIYYTLNQLESSSIITNMDSKINGFSEFLGVETDFRNSTKLGILNYSSATDPFLKEIFTVLKWNCNVTPTLDDCSIFVVAVDDYLDPRLKTLNKEFHKKSIPWILIKPSGSVVRIGPIFHHNLLCWECIESRLANADPIHRIYRHHSQQTAPKEPNLKIEIEAVKTCTAITTTRLLTALSYSFIDFANDILIWDAWSLKLTKHSVQKKPQCVVCGDPSINQKKKASDFNLEKVKHPNQWRVISVDEMLKRVEPFYDPVTGIVMPTNVEFTQLEIPDLVYIYTAKHPFKMNMSDPSIHELYYMSSGKSQSRSGAKLAAICEGIERFTPLFQGDETVIVKSFNEMQKDHPNHIIHPNDINLYSEIQYANRRSNNIGAGAYNTTPIPLPLDVQISWSPIWRLNSKGRILEEPYYVPASTIYFGMPPNEARYSSANSNGLSTGGNYEEAALYSFFELFERDAVAIWWYNKISRPMLDISNLNDTFVNGIVKYCASHGRDVWILDVTNDLQVPTFAAICALKQSGRNIVYGFGAHFDPKIAIHDALLEMVQCLPVIFDWEKNGVMTNVFQSDDFVNWFKEASLQNQPHLLPNSEVKTISDYKVLASSIGEGLEYCLKAIENVGLDAYIIDLIRPDIGIDVTKVVVPGLRLFWHRFAPGRLYDVPVKLGWLQEKKKESQLNSFSVAF